MKLVMVTWTDSAIPKSSGWIRKTDEDVCTLKCVSIGIITSKTDLSITLSHSMNDMDKIEAITIPHCAIKSVRRLKVR